MHWTMVHNVLSDGCEHELRSSRHLASHSSSNLGLKCGGNRGAHYECFIPA
jgi:hypothetical protein